MLSLPLAFAAPTLLGNPYFISILIVCLAFVILIILSASFRRYRRRRNILAYAIFFAIVVLLASQVNTSWNPAIVDFGLSTDGSTRAYIGKTNEILLYGQSHGYQSADFYIVLKAENATLLIPNEKSYIQIDNNTVKAFFSLTKAHELGDNGTKLVYYIIDKDVTAFSFSTFLESNKEIFVTSPINSITYVWSSTEQCYLADTASGFQ